MCQKDILKCAVNGYRFTHGCGTDEHCVYIEALKIIWTFEHQFGTNYLQIFAQPSNAKQKAQMNCSQSFYSLSSLKS